MPSAAILSIRGVGIVPPYTPKFPQPTLSTRMKMMFGRWPVGGVGAGCCACAEVTNSAPDTADAPNNNELPLNNRSRRFNPPLSCFSLMGAPLSGDIAEAKLRAPSTRYSLQNPVSFQLRLA